MMREQDCFFAGAAPRKDRLVRLFFHRVHSGRSQDQTPFSNFWVFMTLIPKSPKFMEKIDISVQPIIETLLKYEEVVLPNVNDKRLGQMLAVTIRITYH